jgi:hypothetical protein
VDNIYKKLDERTKQVSLLQGREEGRVA